jgi:enoyl-CoA hydratase/carnithine racemase
MSEHVRLERDGGLLSITLNRPARRNAITVAMYSALADAIEGAADDESLRVILIRGEGQDFTAGNDLGDFLAELPRDATDIPVWRLLRALARNTVPLVAAVHGNAVGIGTTMLFHCDFVVAEEGTRFVMPFVDLGLVPEAASSLILPRLAGRRRAARYLLLGESFGPDEALDRAGEPCRREGRPCRDDGQDRRRAVSEAGAGAAANAEAAAAGSGR